MRFLGIYLLHGRMQAVAVLVGFMLVEILLPASGIPLIMVKSLLSLLSGASLALFTLRQGFREGLLVIVGAVLTLALIETILSGGTLKATTSTLILWAQIWLLSVVLRESGRIQRMLEVILVLGFLGIVGFFFFSDPIAMWQEMLNERILQPALDNPQPNIDTVQLEGFIQAISHLMTGMLVTGWVFSLLLIMAFGRAWQAQLFNPGGFRKEFLGLRIHRFVAYAFLLFCGLALATGGALSEGVRNASILVIFFYLLVGVSVLHMLVSRTAVAWVMVPLIYVLVALLPIVQLPVALLGFTDAWADWRGRFSANGAGRP